MCLWEGGRESGWVNTPYPRFVPVLSCAKSTKKHQIYGNELKKLLEKNQTHSSDILDTYDRWQLII